jgi:hypothetical protein
MTEHTIGDAAPLSPPKSEGQEDRRAERVMEAAGEERVPEEAGYGYGV